LGNKIKNAPQISERHLSVEMGADAHLVQMML